MPIQNSSEWPVAALDWIETQGLHGRFFAPPDYGSYVGQLKAADGIFLGDILQLHVRINDRADMRRSRHCFQNVAYGFGLTFV